jgi:hypothetical protein
MDDPFVWFGVILMSIGIGGIIGQVVVDRVRYWRERKRIRRDIAGRNSTRS